MARHSPLKWVQENRGKRARAVPVSAPIERLVQRAADPGGVDASSVVAVLRSCVDDAFRRGCRVFVRGDGAISIQVERAGDVYVMRQRWLATVTKAVAAGVPRLAGRRVLFEHGGVGAGFDA